MMVRMLSDFEDKNFTTSLDQNIEINKFKPTAPAIEYLSDTEKDKLLIRSTSSPPPYSELYRKKSNTLKKN